MMSTSSGIATVPSVADRDAVAFFFFFNDTPTTEIYTAQYTLSLHDALPVAARRAARTPAGPGHARGRGLDRPRRARALSGGGGPAAALAGAGLLRLLRLQRCRSARLPTREAGLQRGPELPLAFGGLHRLRALPPLLWNRLRLCAASRLRVRELVDERHLEGGAH